MLWQALEGYPAASMVAFAVDEVGRPIFSFSSISTHKHDVQADPKCSFTVAYKDFKVRGHRGADMRRSDDTGGGACIKPSLRV